jgi:hypothetical protein
MQVNCTKCSEPIALSDVIESSDGRLSHMDCKRPRMLTAEERALLFVYCFGHAAAYCLGCDLRFRMAELAADAFGGGTNLCPRCRKDLTQSARGHVYGCAMLPVEVRLKAQAAREAAQHLVKESQQLRGTSDVLIREAEAALFERPRALREAMSRVKAPNSPLADHSIT